MASIYLTKIAPALSTPTGWTGSVLGCRAGTTSAASQKATLTAINSVRAMAGLSPVAISPTLSKKAQKAALVFKANSSRTTLFLSHTLGSSVKCFSSDAKVAAAHSNIAASTDSTVAGAKGVMGYLDEPGDGNDAAGHRRWILSPNLGRIGVGSTTTTNAVYVLGPTAKSYSNPAWVTWPTSGYFPNQLEPEGRWSISGKQGVSYDYSHATVTVKSSTGRKLGVHKYGVENGYGADTLVFQVAGITRPSGTATKSYTVTLSGVKKAGKRVASVHYTVKLFDPTAK